MMHSEVNADYGILYNTSIVEWSRRAQHNIRLYKSYDKVGLALQDKTHLSRYIISPVTRDGADGAGDPQRHLNRDISEWRTHQQMYGSSANYVYDSQ
ncbi:MAG: hypothetical protein F4Y18_01655 [Cenarchaeum sp. SB0663_bin_5]|nr:hypothetical protein [Cenarchaeum sp. SB0663_bin_5]MYH03445.1 hypothetical protein [Cenarchaeum sp. SB0675_bin_21]